MDRDVRVGEGVQVGKAKQSLPLARNVTLIASGNRTRLATDTYSDSRIRMLASASASATAAAAASFALALALDEDEDAALKYLQRRTRCGAQGRGERGGLGGKLT